MGMNRPDAIKMLGALAGAAGMARLLTGCASDGTHGAGGIETLAFSMMENRSYDHYFGARSVVEGLSGDGLTGDMANPKLDGAPIAIAPATESLMCVTDPPHG